ncbi:MAG: NeuD/PglB/VioB family sugar acetyltransferase [Myxococcales bacterium]
MPALIVLGAGGHGRVVADAAVTAGFEVLGFADDARAGQRLAGLSVWAGDVQSVAERARAASASVVVAIGDNTARERVQSALRDAVVPLATIIHPSAVVAKSARIGEGSVVLAHALVGVDAVVGAGVIVNNGASIDHDGNIGDFVHLSPGVHLGGQVTVGRRAHLAVGVSVRNGVRIGDGSLVGVGAAVVADLPHAIVAVGVPAKVVRSNP